MVREPVEPVRAVESSGQIAGQAGEYLDTDGQPWLTAATCPGWALPQLAAPPSTQVEGPPTASIEPQKSVVVVA